MEYSDKERISHVYRRLGVGAYPDLIESTESVEQAIVRSLDLEFETPELLTMDPPRDRETATDIAQLAGPVQSWLSSMVTSDRLIEERLTWFWHDHFATAIQKVRVPYTLWQQHKTIRCHATGSFAELLNAVAFDPAMLLYLDGARNSRGRINENFAREVMELHTMGTGHYTQEDVTAAARALSGWVVNVPYQQRLNELFGDKDPWSAIYVPFRHDGSTVTFLGSTGSMEPSDVIDRLLEQPATAEFIARKLWIHLVGLEPDHPTVETLASHFRADYSIMTLVEDITASATFTAEEAIRAKVRTPVERLVAISQGLGTDTVPERLGFLLFEMAYLPFNPPSPAGYQEGVVLLGPHQMVHAFDLLAAGTQADDLDAAETLARIGIHDVSENTEEVLTSATGSEIRTALAVNSPEFALV